MLFLMLGFGAGELERFLGLRAVGWECTQDKRLREAISMPIGGCRRSLYRYASLQEGLWQGLLTAEGCRQSAEKADHAGAEAVARRLTILMRARCKFAGSRLAAPHKKSYTKLITVTHAS